MIETILIAVVVVIALVVVLALLKAMYVVVPPNEAHVVVTRSKGRKVYCTREGIIKGQLGEDGKPKVGTSYAGSAYWKIPIVQVVVTIPLENMQISIEGIPLRDMNMAKFLGDVVAWLNITDPLMASERVGQKVSMDEINQDVRNAVQAVCRNESMYSSIIDILKNRKDFSERVEKAVNTELVNWGMVVIELEVIHFTDAQGYTVIHDLEERQATQINTETRKIVAGQIKEANIIETTANKDSESAKAQNEQLFRTAQIVKDEAIAKREQEKNKAIAIAQKDANTEAVNQERAYKVGMADVAKDALVAQATGEAEANFKKGEASARIDRTKGEYEATIKQAVGTAEANIIFAKGEADAKATNLRADALKKYNDAGIGLEVIKATVAIKTVQAEQWGVAMSKAAIKVYSGADNGLLNPSTGFGAGTMAEVAKEMGLDLNEILKNVAKGTLPVVNANDAAGALTEGMKKKAT
jgi:flotillin